MCVNIYPVRRGLNHSHCGLAGFEREGVCGEGLEVHWKSFAIWGRGLLAKRGKLHADKTNHLVQNDQNLTAVSLWMFRPVKETGRVEAQPVLKKDFLYEGVFVLFYFYFLLFAFLPSSIIYFYCRISISRSL